MNLGENFIFKMSKLFGQVGRVDRRVFVHPRVSKVDPFWTYVQNFVVFLLNPLLTFCLKIFFEFFLTKAIFDQNLLFFSLFYLVISKC